MDWLLYENEMINKGYDIICGVDEAGRGPLAGPVYAAAVILPKGHIIEGVNDSKKISEKKREYLYDKIIDECICYSIASANEKEIDEIKDKKLIKEMKAMRGMLFVMRCEYAYALLYEGNVNKANEIRKAFDLTASNYPYLSEIQGERYLMDEALSRY